MRQELFKYLKTNFPQEPHLVNRLIVSVFLEKNRLKVSGNKFLKQFIILEKDNDRGDFQKFLNAVSDFGLDFNLEDLTKIFEFIISPEEKVVTGAVYTPKNIREYIIQECFADFSSLENIKVCDPACGCAGFLYSAAQIIKDHAGKTYREIFSENIYGLDIQEYSVTRSKILLSLLAIMDGENGEEFKFNIFLGNALDFDWSSRVSKFSGFDIVASNPPYVCSRNLDEESRKLIFNWQVSATGHPDLYIPFFQLGVENLNSNGILGFITMNTFFKSVNGRALRQYFENELVELSILDFGGNQIFDSKSTYTCICFIRKKSKSSHIYYSKIDEKDLKGKISLQAISYDSLNHEKGWNLQFGEILNQIERTGLTFGELYRTRNGIATLKNNIYIFKEIDEDDNFYYLRNGSVYPIEKGICKEIINPNKLTQIDNIESLKQKAIFPYFFNEQGEPTLLNEEEFESKYPQAYSYLQAKKDILAKRDKGKGEYENWYAYGRNQSLERYERKLFFPHITPHTPNYVVSDDEDLLFYNGIAVVSEHEKELRFLQKLMSSRLFWFYVTYSSKPYGSGYYSLSRNYIKNFGIAEFSDSEKEELISLDQQTADQIIEKKYGITIP